MIARGAALGLVLLTLGGCMSAGGTRHILSVASAWYKHPVTADVKECGGGFYPGVQIRRYQCGTRYLDAGYVEVENCGDVAAGTLCVTKAEKRHAEERE